MVITHSFLDLDEKWGKLIQVKIYKLSKRVISC